MCLRVNISVAFAPFNNINIRQLWASFLTIKPKDWKPERKRRGKWKEGWLPTSSECRRGWLTAWASSSPTDGTKIYSTCCVPSPGLVSRGETCLLNSSSSWKRKEDRSHLHAINEKNVKGSMRRWSLALLQGAQGNEGRENKAYVLLMQPCLQLLNTTVKQPMWVIYEKCLRVTIALMEYHD